MLNRDDVPFEDIERIEKHIREATGDENVRLFFPGDVPKGELPEDIAKEIKMMEELNEESIQRGFCVDCMQAMPTYRAWDEKWEPDEGWVCLFYPDENPAGWMCPWCVGEMNGENGDVDENERWTITNKDPDSESEELKGDFE